MKVESVTYYEDDWCKDYVASQIGILSRDWKHRFEVGVNARQASASQTDTTVLRTTFYNEIRNTHVIILTFCTSSENQIESFTYNCTSQQVPVTLNPPLTSFTRLSMSSNLLACIHCILYTLALEILCSDSPNQINGPNLFDMKNSHLYLSLSTPFQMIENATTIPGKLPSAL